MPGRTVDGGGLATAGDALRAYLERHPGVLSYVRDETGAVRRHVTVFVDQEQVDHHSVDITALDDNATVSVFQALSGG